ncbi:MAG TPA: DUF1007 family protein [Beijerinckiaceae bacterium]|nr:hypothetical protein [Microvirga sp.]HZB37734.1 DUF1007 family protein [Beijerinckiaceae bacterium]
MTRALLALVPVLAALSVAGPARAHPHVWVTAKAEIVYAEDKVSAVRHVWTFDPGYSAYVTTGLGTNGDGKPTSAELRELAKVNAESLVEFDYFTVLKVNGTKQGFEPPREYDLTFENGQVTLVVVLPVKEAPRGRTVSLEVYDPSFYVSFALAQGDDAVRLAGAPKGCAATVSRPKTVEGTQQKLSESFFEALTAASNYGANFANRAIVACP